MCHLVAQGSNDNALKKSILFHFLPVPLEIETHGDSVRVTCMSREDFDRELRCLGF